MTEQLARVVEEMRRRRVYRVVAAYVVAGLGILGAAELILDPLGMGHLRRMVVLVVLLVFPVVLVSALAYDLRSARRATTLGSGAGSPGIARPGSAEVAARDTPVAEQEIRFCTTDDGVRIAYSIMGSGPPLLRVLGWFTHLEAEWRWPELRFFWETLARRVTLIRYDGRGIGMSDPWTGEFSEENRLRDVDAVLDVAGVDRAALLGISEGGWTAARYAVANPDRVSRLIFYGAYSRGLRVRPGYDPEEDQALMTLVRKGWGRDDPTFRQVFTSDFFTTDADPRLLKHFDDIQRSSADAETAVRYMLAIHGRGDGREMLERVRTPSLVLHRRDDRVVAFEEGRRLATLIRGARFQPLRGDDHYFPVDDEATREVAAQITQFVIGNGARDDRP